MGKVTKEQVMDSFYRTVLLSDKMDELEGLISGKGVSFLPMITDENGETVPEKLEALIKDLIESFKDYLELENRKLRDWEEEMYSCFLYCAMSMTRRKENRRDPLLRLEKRSQSFGDIIELAEDVGTDKSDIESYYDFLKVFYSWYRDECKVVYEKYDRRDFTNKMSKFCSQMMTALKHTFMKPEFFINPLRETRIALCEEYAHENRISKSANAVYLQIAKDPEGFYQDIFDIRQSDRFYPDPRESDPYSYVNEDENEDPYDPVKEKEYERDRAIMRDFGSISRSGSYEDNDLLKVLTPEELIRYERLRCINKNLSENFYYLMHGVDKHELQKRFQRFTELYYDSDHSGFFDNVQRMVETYLIENRLSSFAFGDDYGLVLYQIERAQKRIASEIERVKNR